MIGHRFTRTTLRAHGQRRLTRYGATTGNGFAVGKVKRYY